MAPKKTLIKIKLEISGTDERIAFNADSDFSRDGTEPNYESESKLFDKIDFILDNIKKQIRRIAGHKS